jgi:phosphoribosylformylglycinamidine cyclo-ligase
MHAVVYRASLPRVPVFDLLERYGDIPGEEMEKTFNLGIGYIIIISPGDSVAACKILRAEGYESYNIGIVEKGLRGVSLV